MNEIAFKVKALSHIIYLYKQHKYKEVISAINCAKEMFEDFNFKAVLTNIHPLPDILANYFKLNEL